MRGIRILRLSLEEIQDGKIFRAEKVLNPRSLDSLLGSKEVVLDFHLKEMEKSLKQEIKKHGK